jgi:hypothetical protein
MEKAENYGLVCPKYGEKKINEKKLKYY